MECKIVNMSTRQLKASWIREMVADLSMMHGSFDDVIREYTKEKRKIMNIKSCCFETLSRHYIKYQEGLIKIGNVKQEFVKRLDPFKAEMQDIIKNSNVVLDEKSEQERELRFKELQEQGIGPTVNQQTSTVTNTNTARVITSVSS